MMKSEIYDKRPTLGNPGESWDMYVVRKMREGREERENNKKEKSMLVDLTIYFDSGHIEHIDNVEKESVENLVELYSKPIHGKVLNTQMEEHKPISMDLDGYYSLMEANTG